MYGNTGPSGLDSMGPRLGALGGMPPTSAGVSSGSGGPAGLAGGMRIPGSITPLGSLAGVAVGSSGTASTVPTSAASRGAFSGGIPPSGATGWGASPSAALGAAPAPPGGAGGGGGSSSGSGVASAPRDDFALMNMNDFPSLHSSASSGPPALSAAAVVAGASAASGPPKEDFAMQDRDFPALGGRSHVSAASSAPQSSSTPASAPPSSAAAALAGGGSAAAAAAAAAGGSGGAGGGGGAGGAGGGDVPGTMPADDRYGLLGLLNVIRLPDRDVSSLALGTDLTTLGLNLNSSECLYATFGTPWAETPTARDPQYTLPSCYTMQPPALKTGHLSKFLLATLFYIFYGMPRDVLQQYSARELYTRGWRYHKELHLWFCRQPEALKAAGAPPDAYLYFDVGAWERRIFPQSTAGLAAGFLPEEEAEVKFS